MGTQQTLAGDEAGVRVGRGTQIYCWECNEWMIRTRRGDHPHPVKEELDMGNGGGDDGGDDRADEPKRAGAMYEVGLSYTVDFSFEIPAWTEHEAKERAELLVDYPANCRDVYQVHSTHREKRIIMTDDPKLPDDHDPEMGTPLWEVWGERDGESS